MTDQVDMQALVEFLPVRDAGWTDKQAAGFILRQRTRAIAACRRLLEHRDKSLATPTTEEGLMAFVEMLLDNPKHSKTWVTGPEKRAIRLWHRVVRAKLARG